MPSEDFPKFQQVPFIFFLWSSCGSLSGNIATSLTKCDEAGPPEHAGPTGIGRQDSLAPTFGPYKVVFYALSVKQTHTKKKGDFT